MGTRGLDGQPGWKPVAGLRPPGQNHRPGTQVSSAQWELGKAISLGAAQAAPCPHRVRGLRGASGLPWAAVAVHGAFSNSVRASLSVQHSSRAQVPSLRLTGFIALGHWESSQTRDQTCVPCTGRRILNH